MIQSQSFYIPHLEWEFSDFPIRIGQLNFLETNWGFSEDTIIEVWRNEEFRLCGKICGTVADFKKTDHVNFVNKGNIIKGQIIIGTDNGGNKVELQECHLVSFVTNSLQRNGKGYFTEAELTLDFIIIQCSKNSPPQINHTRFDWFICNKITPHFGQRTFRKALQKKVRIGIDQYDDSIENFISGSISKDYIIIKLPELEFIVAKVPQVMLPNQSYGLCLEFRNNLDKITDDLISAIRYFISFLLGEKIKYVGYSKICDEVLTNSFLQTAELSDQLSSMPPIKFNLKYDWGDISWLINTLLPKFLEIRKALPIDYALSRYWTSRSIPLGSNLPVLASAVEIIAEAHLKQGCDSFQNEYLSKEKYLELIDPELTKLKNKLSCVEGGDVIINKILGGYRKGPNEKMKYFFSLIGIELNKLEKKAIALRNKMAHSYRDYEDEEQAHDDLIYTRVYEVLFNKIILKLLCYKGYYIDYATKGAPLRVI